MFRIPKFLFSAQYRYGILMQKAFYVRASDFIIFGHWKYNMLNFMLIIMAYILKVNQH